MHTGVTQLRSPSVRPKIWVIAGLAGGLVIAALALGYTQFSGKPEASYRRGLAAIPKRDLPALNREIQYLRQFRRYEPHARLLSGVVSLASNDLQSALHQFDASSVYPPTRNAALTLAGETFCRLGREAEAIGVLQQALKFDPRNVDAHRWLAVAYYETGSPTDAIAEMQQATELDPADFRSHRMLAKIYKENNRFEEAVTSYQRCLRYTLTDLARQRVLLELSQSLSRLLRYDEALKVIDQADETADVLACRAGIQYHLGNKVGARKSALRAILLDPQHRDGLTWLSAIEAEGGHYPQSATYLEQLLKVAPADVKARRDLANVYRRLGRTAEADQQTKQADDTRKLQERFTKLQQQAGEKPDDAEVRFQMGELATELKLYRVARACYRAAVSRDPKHVKAQQALKKLPNPPANSSSTVSPDAE